MTNRNPIKTHESTAGDADLKHLATRLEDGYAQIEAAAARGEDIERLENFWLTLLHRYEDLADDLHQAA